MRGIAIVGMAGRFPQAATVEELWHLLVEGREGLERFTPEQLRAAGGDPRSSARGDHVAAGGVVEGVRTIDADFWSFSPREAALLDPQQRLLLECAWEALEDAGHAPSRFRGQVGVFAGLGINTYLLQNLGALDASEDLLAFVGNDKDFGATRVSYKLNLRGPSLGVQTACSSSLVAVHLACQSLLLGECDLALAGGSSVRLPQRAGYLYQPDGIESPDGHCRPFDAAAAGTVFADGAALVVLRRLEDALADGDTIAAVIRGSAVNNDGAAKVGFTAPSFQGQVRAVAEALSMAGVTAGSLAFVETHGTGTSLGDAVEVQALARVFGGTARPRSCALGSLKGNVGHLDTVAGVAGLIKAARALQERVFPGTLHFRRPHPDLGLDAAAPLYVNAEPLALQPAGGPLRAGVSSFGIGGTNAHVVLEEAPAPLAPMTAAAGPAPRAAQLLVLSARSGTARDHAVERLAGALAARPRLAMADVAWTLQDGRERFAHRAIAVADHTDQAAGRLAGPDAWETGEVPARPLGPLCFLFPGQGAQHVGMGRGLYAAEPVFAASLRHAAEVLQPLLGADLLALLYPDREGSELDAERLLRTEIAQPALFAVEVALVRLLESWGLVPGLLLGHSVGEYVAACVASVFTFEEGLRLVAARGRLIQALPRGAMIAVKLAAADLGPWLGPEVALAAENGPDDCVVAGETAAVRRCAAELTAAGHAVRPLHTSHAFHSAMVEPALAAFADELARVRLRPPAVPVVSNLSGRLLSAAEAVDPAYWCRHMRQTVRFAAGLETAFADPGASLLEVGPSQSLTALARRHPARRTGQQVIAAMRHPRDPHDDARHLLRAAGRLWLGGRELAWSGFHPAPAPRRVSLPTYPFERRTYWIEPGGGARKESAAGARLAPADAATLWVPSWKRRPTVARPSLAPGTWLVVADAPLAAPLAAALAARGARAIVASRGAGWRQLGPDRFELDPLAYGPWRELLLAAAPAGGALAGAVYAWGVGAASAVRVPAELLGLVHLLRAIEELEAGGPAALAVLADRLFDVTGVEALNPDRALLLGPLRCAPWELPHLRTCCVDLGDWEQRPAAAARQAVDDLLDPASPPVMAYRGARSWLPAFEPADVAPDMVPQPGAYLITGGLGKVGLELAQAAIERHAGAPVDLYLTGRSPLPHRDDWERALAAAPAATPEHARIARLLAWERAGVRLHPRQVDVTDLDGMRTLASEIGARHGRLDAVLHAAGVVEPGAFAPLAELDAPLCALHLRPKAEGLRVLEAVLRDVAVERFVVCSSISSHLGGAGYAAYAAANAWLDAFCRARSRDVPEPAERAKRAARWLSVGWDAWDFAGEESALGPREPAGLAPEAGRAVLRQLLAGTSTLPGGEVVVARGPLLPRYQAWETAARGTGAPPGAASPAARTETSPPARLWAEVLGLATAAAGRNFFAEGGTSLLAIQLLSRLRRETGVQIRLRDFLQGPTLRDLEQAVAAAAGAAAAGDGEPIPRAPRDRPLPLAPPQQSLWLAEQDDAARGAFLITEALHLRGALDPAALARSFQAIVERHEILRIRLVAGGAEPGQVVLPPGGEVMQLSPLEVPAGADLEAALAPLVEAELGAPFDLAAEPPLRVRLLALSPDEHVLLLCVHHAVADDWSIGVLLGELAALYGGFVTGRQPRLPELPLQYLDWAAWQRRPQRAAALLAANDHWTRRLAGARPLALPVDRARTGSRTFRGGHVPVSVTAAQAAQARELGERESASPFMVLLAAWKSLLHTLCGAEDVVVSTPMAGRRDPQLAPLVGYFIQPVALRTDLGGDPSFRQLVARVRETTLEAEEHQEMPLEAMAAARRAAGDSPGPLFQTWFTLLTHVIRRDLLPGIEARSLRLGPRVARFDLSLVLEPRELAWDGALEFSSDLFDAPHVARIAAGFGEILQLALTDPELRLSALARRLRQADDDARGKRRQAALVSVRRRPVASTD